MEPRQGRQADPGCSDPTQRERAPAFHVRMCQPTGSEVPQAPTHVSEFLYHCSVASSDTVSRRRAIQGAGATAASITALSLPAPASADSVTGMGESTSPADGAPAVTVTDAGTFTVTW